MHCFDSCMGNSLSFQLPEWSDSHEKIHFASVSRRNKKQDSVKKEIERDLALHTRKRETVEGQK